MPHPVNAQTVFMLLVVKHAIFLTWQPVFTQIVFMQLAIKLINLFTPLSDFEIAFLSTTLFEFYLIGFISNFFESTLLSTFILALFFISISILSLTTMFAVFFIST